MEGKVIRKRKKKREKQKTRKKRKKERKKESKEIKKKKKNLFFSLFFSGILVLVKQMEKVTIISASMSNSLSPRDIFVCCPLVV